MLKNMKNEGTKKEEKTNNNSRKALIVALALALIMTAVVAETLYNFYDSTQACQIQNSGTWGACSGTYPSACPADRLGCNDGTVEQSTTNSGAATGLNMTDFNSSELYCDQITSVFFCYEWWVTGGATQNCQITVSNQSGANPTAIVTTCPGATANPGVQCINVTATKGWTCENFFGPSGQRAVATATLYKSGPGGRTISYDVFAFNVTYKKSPRVSLISPANGTTLNYPNITFQCNGNYNVNLANVTLYYNYSGTWIANETISITGTNYTANFTKTLNPTNVIWNCQFCGSDGNCKFASANWTLTVIDNTSPVINSVSDYPDPVQNRQNITFVANVTDDFRVSVVKLEINGTNYTMIQNTSTTWYYVYNTSGLSLGTYNYTIYANDTSGNNATPMTGNFTVIITPMIYTDRTLYKNCSDTTIYYKISVFDLNDQPINTALTSTILDAVNATVMTENVNTGNGGTGVYLGVFPIPGGYQPGNWIVKAVSGSVKGQKTINVS